jgi:hypothetical protein
MRPDSQDELLTVPFGGSPQTSEVIRQVEEREEFRFARALT